MRTTATIRLSAAFLTTLAAVATATILTSAASPKFYNDDPVWVERGTEDAVRHEAVGARPVR